LREPRRRSWIEDGPGAQVLVVPTTDTDAYIIASALPHLQEPVD